MNEDASAASGTATRPRSNRDAGSPQSQMGASCWPSANMNAQCLQHKLIFSSSIANEHQGVIPDVPHIVPDHAKCTTFLKKVQQRDRITNLHDSLGCDEGLKKRAACSSIVSNDAKPHCMHRHGLGFVLVMRLLVQVRHLLVGLGSLICKCQGKTERSQVQVRHHRTPCDGANDAIANTDWTGGGCSLHEEVASPESESSS